MCLYLSLYDLWKFTFNGLSEEQNILAFQTRMRVKKTNPQYWEECESLWKNLFLLTYQHNNITNIFIEEGKILLKYDQIQKNILELMVLKPL